ncbi:MAG: ATP-binding cassette domain-containing protein [Acidobacteria bacterium]|nr:ATP-binding cassette domain-containing protein [Acidobacteriota bacterium]
MIKAEHLTKRFGLATAIEDVSFEVGKGEILGFLGPNGAGKTTTMRILAGFFPATQGIAVVAGYDVFKQPLDVKRRVGYLPENPPLYSEMKVDSYLRFVATINGVAKSKIETQLEKVKQRCGLADHGKRLIKHLSKGYKQRVGLAQALIHDPEVLILDEPTIGLDPKQIIEVRELIKSLAGRHTIILSTHILPEVSMTCQRVIIINEGRIVAMDTPENLTSRLQGGELIEVEAAGDVERVHGLFKDIPQIRNVSVGPPSNGHFILTINVEGKEEVRHLISRRMIEAGLNLYQMKVQTMTLEEIFLKLTTREEGAA